MRIPNCVREFFLLSPNPPRHPVRYTGNDAVQTQRRYRKGVRDAPEQPYDRPEPEVIRKKVRVGIRDAIPESCIELKKCKDEGHALNAFWFCLYFMMRNHGRVRFRQNDYYGHFRGVDVLIFAKGAFRRAGIPVDVKLCGSHGFISLKESS